MASETLLIWLRNGLKFKLIAETPPEIKLIAETSAAPCRISSVANKTIPGRRCSPKVLMGLFFGVFSELPRKINTLFVASRVTTRILYLTSAKQD